MATNTNQRAAFLAALTATDQMAPAERQRLADDARRAAKALAKDRRHGARLDALAAYHEAEAANLRAMRCRMLPATADDKARCAAEHHAMVLLLIETYRPFMLLPLLGTDDAKDRRSLIRKGRSVVGGGPLWEVYQVAERQWLAHIEADAARIGAKA